MDHVVSGVLTCMMIYAAIAPQAALQSTFGETLQGPLAEIVVRNWGVLITVVGAMLIYGAYHPPSRRLVLTVAAVTKLVFILLVLSQGSRYLGQQAGIAIADRCRVGRSCSPLISWRHAATSTAASSRAGTARRTCRAGRRGRAAIVIGLAGGALDRLVGRELAAVPVEVLAQPAVQRGELAARDLAAGSRDAPSAPPHRTARSGCCRWCSPGSRRRRCRRTSARPAGSRRGRRAARCRGRPGCARARPRAGPSPRSRPSSRSSSRSKRSMTCRL